MEKKINLDDGVFFASRGGGIRSCVSIGVLRALEEARIPVRGVSGESLGSLFAALVAKGYNSNEIMDLFLEYNKIITGGSKLLGGRGSVVIQESVDKVTDNMQFKDTKTDCYINACTGKLLNPDLVLFSKDTTPNETLGTACRASASLPILFGNCDLDINGQTINLFDGGFKHNPYIPETDLPVVYASFHNWIDYYKLIPHLRKIIDEARNASDVEIYAPVGGILVTGSNKDMLKCYESGYKEAQRVLKPKKTFY